MSHNNKQDWVDAYNRGIDANYREGLRQGLEEAIKVIERIVATEACREGFCTDEACRALHRVASEVRALKDKAP